MKSSSKLLLALLALLLAFCLFCKFCHHTNESCACTPPNPIFTLTPTGVIIQSDNLGGPAAKIEVVVTGEGSGGTLTLIDTTINAGTKIFVPVPNIIQQINIQMDYLDESLNICPVHVSLRTVFIVMDVIVELNDEIPLQKCPNCQSKLINQNTSPVYDMLVPSNNSHLLTLQLGNTQVNIEYEVDSTGNKIIITPCEGLRMEETDGVIVFKNGADPVFELIISKYGLSGQQHFKFTVNRLSTEPYEVGSCSN